jgi:Dolichyl-phosphate-mannose-protein mannosyltransferase
MGSRSRSRPERVERDAAQAGGQDLMSDGAFVAKVESRFGLDTIVIGILVFFVAHTLIRLFGTSNFNVDETMTAIHTQRFQLYYVFTNPPLFDWLYFALSRLIGNDFLTMQLLKATLLTGGAIFFYWAVKPAFQHRTALVCAVASYGATAFYGWEILQLYSHTNALIFSMGFAFWAFMRVVRSGRTVDYVLLGLGLGLGILSKYLFALFFLAFVVAALRSRSYRRYLLSWRVVLTLATAIVLVSPLLYGLAAPIDAAASAVGRKIASDNSLVSSVSNFVVQSAQFWLPFTLILWACLARWPAGRTTPAPVAREDQEARDDEDFYALVRDATLIMVAAMFAAVLFMRPRITAGHYLVPALSLLPTAIFAGLDRRQVFPEVALRKFRDGALAIMVAVAVVRLLFFLFAAPPFCIPRCILFVDYTPVLEKLDTSDDRQLVILSNDVHLASNLLGALPNARVIVPTDTGGLDVGIAAPDERSCYLVWFRTYRGTPEQAVDQALSRTLRRQPLEQERAAIGPVEYVKAKWQTKLLGDRGPDTLIGIATIDSASPLCGRVE